MIRTLCSCIVLALCLEIAGATDLTGTNETSFSGQFGFEKIHRDYDSPYSSDTHDDKAQFVTLILRHGVYVYHGLEFEPELHWTNISGLESAVSLQANVAYNFTGALRPERRQVGMPFVLVGYGVGNSAPRYFTFLAKTGNKAVPVFNAGAGMKAFVNEFVAMRVEYRYQRYAYSYDYGTAREHYDQRYHNIFFGFSIFFPPHKPASGKSILND